MIRSDLNLLVYAPNAAGHRHAAARALEQQAELHSTDPDFARFAGLRWRNPLEKKKAG